MIGVIDEGMRMEAFRRPAVPDRGKAEKALEAALRKIDGNLETFGSRFPGTVTRGNVYGLRTPENENPTKDPVEIGGNFDWTTGFWTGMLWLAYEMTGEPRYRRMAELHVESFADRIRRRVDTDTHDLGFLYTLSCVSAWKLTGNEKAKTAALQAADHLMTRYFEKAGIIQAHGDLNDPRLRGRIIIDCLMNLPLLYWAAETTGRETYRNAARRHAENTLKYIVRPDASTYHTYYFDTETGEGKHGDTLQGFSDDSCWSRGQAWGIYGFVLSHVYLRDPVFLDASRKLAHYFLNRSPQDFVVYWDLVFTDGSGEPRDSSASAIAVCGLLELSKWLPEEEGGGYFRNAAVRILESLIDRYSTVSDDRSNALLLHATYFKKRDWGLL